MTSVRLDLLALLQRRPGCCIQDAASELRINPSTVSYHVHRLKREGLLVTTQGTRGMRHLLPLAPRVGEDQRALLRLGEAVYVVDALRLAERPLSAVEVAGATLRSLDVVLTMLNRAVKAGVVVREGRLYALGRRRENP